MNIKDELLELIQVLNSANVQFAVCGGLALVIHGFVRATQDIDLLLPESQLEAALEAAKPAGFWIPSGRMPFKAKTPLAMEIYRVSKAVGPNLIPLDLIIVSPSLQEIWDSRESFKLGDIDCPVISREGLIRMKTIAGRLQDLADIERLQNGE